MKALDLKPSAPMDVTDAMQTMKRLLAEYFAALPDESNEHATKAFVASAMEDGFKFGLQFFPTDNAFGFVLLSPSSGNTLHLGVTTYTDVGSMH